GPAGDTGRPVRARDLEHERGRALAALAPARAGRGGGDGGTEAARGGFRLSTAALAGDAGRRHHPSAGKPVCAAGARGRAGSGAAGLAPARRPVPRRVRLAPRAATGGAGVHRLPGRAAAADAGGGAGGVLRAASQVERTHGRLAQAAEHGGEGGIRTHGRVATTADRKSTRL